MPLVPFLDALFGDPTYKIGSSKCMGTGESKYDVQTGRLMKALLDYCWSPEEFAKEIVTELYKCTRIAYLGMYCFSVFKFI
jgi:hypothetical protein